MFIKLTKLEGDIEKSISIALADVRAWESVTQKNDTDKRLKTNVYLFSGKTMSVLESEEMLDNLLHQANMMVNFERKKYDL